jgi:hypothetical protein
LSPGNSPPSERGTLHPQVTVQVGEILAEIDRQIAPLVREIWRAGYETSRSCQRHLTGKVWIEFVRASDVQAFLDIVVTRDAPSDLWLRANSWAFGMFGAQSGCVPVTLAARRDGAVTAANVWEFHVSVEDYSFDNAAGCFAEPGPNFCLGISVLIPRTDLPAVTASLKARNDAVAS